MTVAVLGGTGFIGSTIVARCRSTGVPVACLSAPRISAAWGSVGDAAALWRRTNGDAFDALCQALAPFHVVVNAAGLATPDAGDTATLFGANAVLPSVVAQAARCAGVRRLVHVSTAAVQGRLNPVDETSRVFPLSPYAAAKAEAERAVLGGADGPPEVVVYRPTSVHGPGRTVTRRLARIAPSLPLVPVSGDDRPSPVALVENVAAGIVFAASMSVPHPIVLQPWEGITTSRLLELFGARRVVRLPPAAVGAVVELAARSVARSPTLTGHVRRVEVVVRGQGVRAENLAAAGFHPPAGWDRWEDLARTERAAARRRVSRLAVTGPA